MTADLERRALREDALLMGERGRTLVGVGVLLAMTSSAVVMFMLLVTGPLMLVAAIVLGGIGGGAASIARGAALLRTSKRTMRELDEPLPRARLVK
jgi:hypothetical protein